MIVLIVALVVAVLALSGATLASDATALARVSVGPLGGTIERVQAFGPAGRPVPLAVSGGRLTPLTRLHPGEQVSVDVTVRRPGWIGWALGHTRTEHLALLAPIAQVSEHWMTVSPGAPVQVSFDGPVSAVAYGSTGNLTQHTLGGAQRSISLGTPTCRSNWHPSGGSVVVPRTPSAQAQAAVNPPSGAFGWRYPNTPHQLRALWSPGQWSVAMKGAVMKFENANNMTVNGEAGPAVWRALLGYVLAGKRFSEPYSYVYVHREVPETMTLWSAGRTVITSPANTGISGAETELGTFPVFEHIPEGTMSGTNPDGSHYEDPGIKWISYFNGGDALHNFDRSSFGTPQSLGCVELPLEASAEIWPYTPIGTLVTIET